MRFGSRRVFTRRRSAHRRRVDLDQRVVAAIGDEQRALVLRQRVAFGPRPRHHRNRRDGRVARVELRHRVRQQVHAVGPLRVGGQRHQVRLDAARGQRPCSARPALADRRTPAACRAPRSSHTAAPGRRTPCRAAGSTATGRACARARVTAGRSPQYDGRRRARGSTPSRCRRCRHRRSGAAGRRRTRAGSSAARCARAPRRCRGHTR